MALWGQCVQFGPPEGQDGTQQGTQDQEESQECPSSQFILQKDVATASDEQMRPSTLLKEG